MFNQGDNLAYAESDIIRLKNEVEELKVKLETAEAAIIKRDACNGGLMATVAEKDEEIEALQEDLAAAIKAHDNKSMSNCDQARKINRLENEKFDLEAQVGRLTGDVEKTWEEGLRKFIVQSVQDALYERDCSTL